MKQKERLAVALGSNVGDRLATLREACRRLGEDLLENAACSSIYETAPWGVEDQPAFLNAVVVGDSDWKPPAVVNFLKSLERELGREPGPRFGPRVIDLDLVAWGNHRWEGDGVKVPHPRWADRDFVIVPLKEVWPDWVPPGETSPVSSRATAGSEGRFAPRVIAPPPLDKASP